MSTPELLAAYLHQRARARLLVPLAFVLASAGCILAPSISFDVVPFFIAASQAFVFTLAFRVWDDLEDRLADRARFPDRVMGICGRTTPFVVLALTLAALGAAAVLQLSDPLPRITALA